MHDGLLQDLAVVLIFAAVVTVLCHRLRQPVVLGYILAGLIIGPHTPPFPLVTHTENIQTLAQLGIVMLMFSLGLQMSFKRFLKVGPTAAIAAAFEILLMVWIGYMVGRSFGWSTTDALFLGAMLLSSSTVIIIKVLNDLGLSREKFAEVTFGILVIDDVAAILAIGVLSGVVVSGSLATGDALTLSWQIAVFLAAVLVIGLLAVPRLLRYVSRFDNNEVLLVTVLGMGFGLALLALKLGFSTALGAFIIGAIIAETRQGARITELVAPVRDMFSAVFFVSVGLMVDPLLLLDYWAPALIITVTLVVGKTVTGALGSFVAGHDRRTSLRVGLSLAQIGEFAFIIASLGHMVGSKQQVPSPFLYPIAVVVSFVTAFLSPYLIKHSDKAVDLFERWSPGPIKQVMDLYTGWVARNAARNSSVIRQMVRRTIIQITLNLTLVTGLFLCAAFLARWLNQREVISVGPGGADTIAWLLAMLCSLPLLLATFRKIRAMAMLLAELSVSAAIAGRHTVTTRRIVSSTMLSVGVAGVGLLLLVLSSAILPPLNVLLALGAVIVGIAALRWKSFIKVYASAQSELEEILRDAPPPQPQPPPPPLLPPQLRQAQLDLVEITPDSPAVGRLIRELDLRAKTGVSAVAIEREGQSIVNPGPDVELRAGDKILLLGSAAQLQAGIKLLTDPRSGLTSDPPA